MPPIPLAEPFARFSALLAESRHRARTSVDEAVGLLATYRDRLPGGQHAADVDLWSRRLRGQEPAAPIVKERD